MEHRIVSQDEWIAARQRLLIKEKELIRMSDRLSAERRELPWARVEANYLFDDAKGKVSLADLFAGRSQLIVYHFMFGPGRQEGCIGCSFLSDHIDGAVVHLLNHDVSYVAVSRAPLPEIDAFKRRMGWRFRWVSSFDSRFNHDFGVSFTPEQRAAGKVYHNYEMCDFVSEDLQGVSVFYKNDDGAVFHTYSCYARGAEGVLGAYALLDMTPKGRNETGPTHTLADWVRHHDRYRQEALANPNGQDEPLIESSCACEAETRRS